MSQATGRVLVVDDDRAVRSALRVNLSRAGYDLVLCNSAEEAIGHLTDHPVDLVLSDVKMPGIGGMALLAHLRAHWPDTQVVMMTGHGSVNDAVSAMKSGAADYIIKPISRDELLMILDKALRAKALESEVTQLRSKLQERYGFEKLVGNTPAMQRVYELVAAVAESEALVLLTGPTGTGKELLAHAIHYRSRRRNGPFVALNCTALPEGLLESELFGHEKGAFTGAVRQHQGKFEQATGGTILLDEIGEIPLATQARLLRVLESGDLQRVGGRETIRVDTRVVAATNRDLRQEVKAGRFREDLYYRLNVFHIPVPALRERMGDLPLLVDHFVAHFAGKYTKPVDRVSQPVLDALMTHSWPGNVRELEHLLERAVILCTSDEITEVGLPSPEPEPAPKASGAGDPGVLPTGWSIGDALRDLERRLVIEALKQEKGVQARAARRLGISRSNLNYRIQKLGIQVQEVRYD